MNDAERDAWLREALRHAPDSDAVPPSGVSEAILLKARAAARVGTTSPRRGTGIAPPANSLAAFWAWLARPPVAAGFASVMAATLVGLMWWNGPIDETMPRPQALARDHADGATRFTGTAPATAPAPPPATAPVPAAAPALPADATKTTTPAWREAAKAATDDRDVERRQGRALEQSAAGNARIAEPATAAAKRKVEPLAQERALAVESKSEAPAPFSSREAPAAAAPKPLDAVPTDAKKDAEAGRSRAADALDRAATPPAAQAIAPTLPATRPPAAAPAPTSPLAGGRLAGDEGRPAGALQGQGAMAKSAIGAAPAAPAAATAAPREVAAAPFGERAQRQRALGDAREKDAAAFARSAPAAATAQTPPPAPFRNELERASPDSTTRADAAKQAAADPTTQADARARADAATRADAPTRANAARTAPLTPLLAAIAADPERWSRRTAKGDTVALDAGWRAWLAELDAAAAGRWRLLGDVAAAADGAAARDRTTTLRLVTAGRVAAVVRNDGTTVQVDASPGTGTDRWQATLSPNNAERLRTTARRLSP